MTTQHTAPTTTTTMQSQLAAAAEILQGDYSTADKVSALLDMHASLDAWADALVLESWRELQREALRSSNTR